VLLTVPLPVPDVLTVRSTDCDVANVAMTVVVEVRVTVQGPVPVQPPPLQPENAEPVAPVAVRVTGVPPARVAEQVAPQMIPDGVLITVPLPAPIFTTVRPRACAVAPHAMLE
jgi:hypothetical protein